MLCVVNLCHSDINVRLCRSLRLDFAFALFFLI